MNWTMLEPVSDTPHSSKFSGVVLAGVAVVTVVEPPAPVVVAGLVVVAGFVVVFTVVFVVVLVVVIMVVGLIVVGGGLSIIKILYYP